MLARFITKIELDYHRAKIWYTFPIENNPIVDVSSGGTLLNRRMAVFSYNTVHPANWQSARLTLHRQIPYQ
jgi:hypothetical protein